MKIFIGTDHRGFKLKEKLKIWLVEAGYAVDDVGAHVYQSDDDYTDYASAVAFKVSNDKESKGIVFCGSGVGVDIVANKIDGVRSGYGVTIEQIISARRDDDINVLAIAADFIDFEKAKELIQVFLGTEYKKTERFERRLDKIQEIEKKN